MKFARKFLFYECVLRVITLVRTPLCWRIALLLSPINYFLLCETISLWSQNIAFAILPFHIDWQISGHYKIRIHEIWSTANQVTALIACLPKHEYAGGKQTYRQQSSPLFFITVDLKISVELTEIKMYSYYSIVCYSVLSSYRAWIFDSFVQIQIGCYFFSLQLQVS